MNLDPMLTDHQKRQDLMDLTFSLYECLGDLMEDVIKLEARDGYNPELLIDRISTSAMNCLADIKLLKPGLVRLMSMRYENDPLP